MLIALEPAPAIQAALSDLEALAFQTPAGSALRRGVLGLVRDLRRCEGDHVSPALLSRLLSTRVQPTGPEMALLLESGGLVAPEPLASQIRLIGARLANLSPDGGELLFLDDHLSSLAAAPAMLTPPQPLKPPAPRRWHFRRRGAKPEIVR